MIDDDIILQLGQLGKVKGEGICHFSARLGQKEGCVCGHALLTTNWSFLSQSWYKICLMLFFFFKLLESERVIVSQLCVQPVAGLTQFKDAYFIGLIAKTKRNPKNPQNYIWRITHLIVDLSHVNAFSASIFCSSLLSISYFKLQICTWSVPSKAISWG